MSHSATCALFVSGLVQVATLGTGLQKVVVATPPTPNAKQATQISQQIDQEFSTADAAAVYFTDFVHQNLRPKFIEHCAYIRRERNGKFTIGPIIKGTPGSCPISQISMPSEAIAIAHTHPHSEDSLNRDLSHTFQAQSDGDYLVAEVNKMTVYLGALGRHVLKQRVRLLHRRSRARAWQGHIGSIAIESLWRRQFRSSLSQEIIGRIRFFSAGFTFG